MCIARSLVSYGLLPTFGVFHHSEVNAYNLADDMVEVLRPMVDMIVKKLELEDSLKFDLDTDIKSSLLQVLDMKMQLDGESVRILNICDAIAHTFVKSIKLNDADSLVLPSVL